VRCYERSLCNSRILCGQQSPLAVKQTLAVCLPDLAGGRIDRSLRFLAKSDAASSMLKLTLEPLQSAATTVSRASLVGSSIVGQSPIVNARFSHLLGSYLLPGTANSLSGRDVQFEDLLNQGPFPGMLTCATMSGNITQPIVSPFTAKCIFVNDVPAGTQFSFSSDGSSMKMGAPISRILTAADFTCR
jgi:hypothetical protein